MIGIILLTIPVEEAVSIASTSFLFHRAVVMQSPTKFLGGLCERDEEK
jgi:hypothetical protein